MFEDIEFRWKGTSYTLRADKVLRAIASIEEVITLHELSTYQNRGTIPAGKISMAYGTLLRMAGARVKDEEVYSSIIQDASSDQMLETTMLLMRMMLPPDSLTNGAEGEGKATADSSTSGPPTDSPSEADG